MQRIHRCELTPEAYHHSEAHRQIRPEALCPRCGRCGPLHRHGCYSRHITDSAGAVLLISVARFLCLGCGHTVSYLPSFALSYRLVQAATFEAFLDGKLGAPAVQRWLALLQDYQRRLVAFAPQLWRVLGCGWGRAPPGDGRPWPWLREACGSLSAAARRLVTAFSISLFRRYQCHQPAAD